MAIHLESLDRGGQVLESALVLGAGLTWAVAEVAERFSLGIWLWGRVWLSNGFGNGVSCAFDFGAGLAGTVAPSVAGGFGLCKSVLAGSFKIYK